MPKSQFLSKLTITATALAQSFDNANTLISAYFDRGYGSGGANELTSNDLAAVGLTPAQVASAITLFQQLQAMRNNGAVVPADYDATLNMLRQDL
jgi:hypothetical protein